MQPLKHFPTRLALRGRNFLRQVVRRAGTRCLLCGTAMPYAMPKSLCPGCTDLMGPHLSGFCPKCGEIFALESEEVSLCGSCRLNAPPWTDFGFHGAYRDPLRTAITQFKFQANFGFLALLQHLTLQAFQLHLSHKGYELVLPVPLHSSRLRQRGFNQSLELCRPLAKSCGAKLATGALKRTRDTVPQSGLDRSQRRKNLQGAIAADKKKVKFRRVLLVDDVYTTGITARVAARALINSGARSVDLLVLARVPEG